jgi:hypothetical protein
MTKDEALRMALEALETYHGYMEPLLTVFGGPRVPAEQSTTWKVEQAINAIKEALAQSEQEPVAWFSPLGNLYKTRFHATANGEQVITPLYTTPQRTWVGLDHHDKKKFSSWLDHKTDDEVFTAIEAKLKELNT